MTQRQRYAKFISETRIEYPDASEFRGIPNWQLNDPLLRRKGYVPIRFFPEYRDGYTLVLDKFALTTQTVTRNEPRMEDPVTHEPFLEDVYEEDPNTHERVKVGTRRVTREVNVEFDDSYISVTEFHYDEIATPEPPDMTDRDTAEKAIVQAILEAATRYNALQELTSMQDINIPALKALASEKGMPDSEFDALILKLTPCKWQLEAVSGTTWAECWDGLKSRFAQWMQELAE